MQTAARRSPAPGFTLIELMVSIALVLIIILGVNAIFKMTSDTVGAGQALSSADRENRAIQSVLYNDFQTGVFTNGPMLLIRSERVAAFRNRADELADRDFNPTAGPAQQYASMLTVDMDNNNREGEAGVPGEITTPAIVNSRNHRVDRVAFFANHLFRRQTGLDSASGTRYIDDATSNEAYIWLGHLRQPDFGRPLSTAERFEHRLPGQLPKNQNPNNFYATDWILGRVVTLLRPLPPVGQSFVNDAPPASPDAPPDLAPISPGSRTRVSSGGGANERYAWSTCDVALTSINAFRSKLQNHVAAWELAPNPATAWWQNLGEERFEGYPYPNRPMNAYGVSRTVPVFVRGCTQFIVEYAGDYLAQRVDDGNVVSTVLDGLDKNDGLVDFVVVSQTNERGDLEKVRRIRWYGFPRNVDPSDDTGGPNIRGGVGARNDPNALRDVVPLRDVLLSASPSAVLPLNFIEKFYNLDMKLNYAAATGIDPSPPGTTNFPRYYAAWGPTELTKGTPNYAMRPRMVRITLAVDEPNGRLTEAQSYEYVIDLP